MLFQSETSQRKLLKFAIFQVYLEPSMSFETLVSRDPINPQQPDIHNCVDHPTSPEKKMKNIFMLFDNLKASLHAQLTLSFPYTGIGYFINRLYKYFQCANAAMNYCIRKIKINEKELSR